MRLSNSLHSAYWWYYLQEIDQLGDEASIHSQSSDSQVTKTSNDSTQKDCNALADASDTNNTFQSDSSSLNTNHTQDNISQSQDSKLLISQSQNAKPVDVETFSETPVQSVVSESETVISQSAEVIISTSQIEDKSEDAHATPTNQSASRADESAAQPTVSDSNDGDSASKNCPVASLEMSDTDDNDLLIVEGEDDPPQTSVSSWQIYLIKYKYVFT